jgi:hypothetical protein
MTGTLWAGLWAVRTDSPRRPVGVLQPPGALEASQFGEETSRVLQRIDLADP